MFRAISADGGLVVCAVDSTRMVAEMERIHKTSAVVSAALGRVLTAASLMGSYLKGERDSLTLRVNGGGPIGTLLAVSDEKGNVRGYAEHPVVELPLRKDGKLDVGSAVGQAGNLSVIRDMGLKEPYIGQVALASGEIAEDITAYYARSEQTPCVCALGVLVEKDLSIRRAGGYLLQVLPGADEKELERLENNIASMRPVTELLEEGRSAREIAMMALEGFEPELLDGRHVAYCCYCSREKTEKILISLGVEELEKMREENTTAEVTCHFCAKRYEIDIDELLRDMRG